MHDTDANGGKRGILGTRLDPCASLIALIVSYVLLVVVWVSVKSQVWVGTANPWNLGDWLINYDAGFVRRGAIGTAIMWVSDVTSCSALRVTNVLQISTYFAVFVVLVALIIRRRPSFWFLLLVFSPVTFLFPVMSLQGAGRKEILYFLCLASWCLYLDRKPRVGPVAMVVFSVVTSLLMLSHEGMIFFVAFFTGAYVICRRARGERIVAGHALLIPVVAIATVATVYRFGQMTETHRGLIIDSILGRGLPREVVGGSISWPGQNLHANLRSCLRHLKREPYYPVSWALSLVPIGVLVASLRTGRWPVARVLAGCVALTLPIYFLGTDSGRWIHITAMSLLFVTVPLLDDSDAVRPAAPVMKGLWVQAAALAAYMLIWSVPVNTWSGLQPGVGWLILTRLF